MAETHEAILPDRYRAGVDRFMRRDFRKRLSKAFFAVRVMHGTRESLADANEYEGPLLVVFNHPGWWDPIAGKHIGYELMPDRPTLAPMDRDQVERFAFFRWLGLFGIDPDDPAVLEPMVDFVRTRFAENPKRSFWITAQGQFTDVRAPIRLRPGAAALAARLDRPRVVVLSFEYTFWQDTKPEVFVRGDTCETPEGDSTTAWLRAMTSALQQNQDKLAKAVIARQTDAFEILLGGEEAKINPFYDLWLKVRGKGGSVPMRDRNSEQHNHNGETP
ncbi:MAG: lysophospholipid acyltransferase family protein [Planctomycetota bacterium]